MPNYTGPPAFELGCPFHCRPTCHFRRLSRTYAGAGRRSVQHLLAARHVDWIDDNSGH